MNMDRDPRYEHIREKIEQGNIRSFNDIFFFIPKTVVANDLGKKVDRFNDMMEHVEKFTLEDLYQLAKHCKINGMDMLVLVDKEYNKQLNRAKKRANSD